jgi:hypothetical protein
MADISTFSQIYYRSTDFLAPRVAYKFERLGKQREVSTSTKQTDPMQKFVLMAEGMLQVMQIRGNNRKA